MFGDRLEAARSDRRALADLAAKAEQRAKLWSCRKLEMAAAWADAHSEVDHPEGGVLVERLLSIGPVGTPPVAEFAAAGLVPLFETTVFSARSWMADALTIQHRLPRLWDRVVAGQVHAWQARQIATLTGHLSVIACGQVDEQTTPWIAQLPWTRFLTLLDATMLDVDEKAYREREKLVAAKKEVRATQSQDGLRTLIARGEAGDVAMMLALHQRVAAYLADEGDEDPLPVRMAKAMGWIANPARCNDLLLRHAGDPDPHRDPWEQVAAHAADPTDPWADDLPPAGWETAPHSNYHQPAFDDDDWWDTPRPDQHDRAYETWPADPPIDDNDLAWYHRNQDDHDDAEPDGDECHEATETPSDTRSAACTCGAGASSARWPEAFRPRWQPLTPAQAAVCAPTVVMHVHLTEGTLLDGHGIVRTDAGAILLEQLRQFLLQHDANVKVYPVIDPAETASADAYEIPIRLRRAMQIRNPRSVFPHSPTMSRTDLDHTPAYRYDGPPSQTGMHTLGPLARSEHRAKTIGHWQSKQPEPGTHLWRSPEDWIAITTNQGTLVLGHTTWATQLWDTAA